MFFRCGAAFQQRIAADETDIWQIFAVLQILDEPFRDAFRVFEGVRLQQHGAFDRTGEIDLPRKIPLLLVIFERQGLGNVIKVFAILSFSHLDRLNESHVAEADVPIELDVVGNDAG